MSRSSKKRWTFGALVVGILTIVALAVSVGAGTAAVVVAPVNTPLVRITNHRPTLAILSIRFTGATVYARFRICDDSYKNLTVLARDSRPGVAPQTRRFTTLVAPKPCLCPLQAHGCGSAYTRHWVLAPRFRGHGKYTVTLRATDKSGLTSLPASRTFTR